MANQFSKEERVMFEDVGASFNDSLVLSRLVSKYQTDQTMMERSNDTIWRPKPYIARSINRVPGTPITYQDAVQLSVPSQINQGKAVPWTMNAKELRDSLQEGTFGKAAVQRIASDINRSVMDAAANLGSVVVTVTGAAGDYDDIALCDSAFNELGVPQEDRYMALSSRDYNGLAGNLAAVTRSFGNQKSDKAYERSLVGPVAGFETHKLDYANRLVARGATGVTMNTTGALVNFTPQATSNSVGGRINVDNRFQQITVSSTTNAKAGDTFTVAGLESVHMITKQSTGQLKTFRVVSIDSGTTMTITPPMIGATGTPTDAQLAYKNINVASTSATAAITFTNLNSTNINCFWHKDAIEILPGRYAIPRNAGADILSMTTDQGLEVVMQKQYDIDTMQTKYSVDCLWGVVNKDPEMSGILLFNQ
jgi:hypothetical protein